MTIASNPPTALTVQSIAISQHCVGSRWVSANIDYLARTIAVIAMGQATHAAQIIRKMLPAEPAINHDQLREAAKAQLSIVGSNQAQIKARRSHRDGLIFESISWIAAQQSVTGLALLRDPHLSSTTQGLDGLMIELDASGVAITCATIFEDKCSEDPREQFREKIMPAFRMAHHGSKRAPDLVATAASLLEKTGMDGTAASKASARVLDKTYRAYRGSLAITPTDDTIDRYQALFKDYEDLDGIDAARRIGGMLVTADDLRAWFDELANKAVAYIDSLVKGGPNV